MIQRILIFVFIFKDPTGLLFQ